MMVDALILFQFIFQICMSKLNVAPQVILRIAYNLIFQYSGLHVYRYTRNSCTSDDLDLHE